MRILIPTIGSRGDVQPFIALSQGLVRSGHTVTLASHPLMEPLVQSHGVNFCPIGPDIDLAQKVAEIRSSSRSALAGLIRGMRFSFDMLERSHEDIFDLCHDADLVVVSAQSAAGKNEAELLELPYLSVTLMPWAIPWDDPQRPLLKRAVYRLIDGLLSLLTTRPLNRIRKKLGLPPVGREGFTSPRMNLVPVSPEVYEPNPHWEPRHRVVGYWFVEDPIEWNPPEDLVTFLEAGEAPVLISLGAMSLGDVNAMEIVRLFVDTIQSVNARAIIQGWQAGIKRVDLPPTIYPSGSLPHSWLLPRCSAVIHHGGFGTTAAGLRAGIPALVIPHIADQFYWAQILHELGISPKPLPRSKLNVESLALSIGALANGNDMRTVAGALGERIRSEKGVDNAVEQIVREFHWKG